MPSMQTLFRTVVMVVVGAVAFKAWKLYGPTNEQVKSTLTQGVETVQSAVENWRQPNANTLPDPRAGAPPIAQTPPATPPATPVAQAEAPKLLPQSTPPTATPPAPRPPVASNEPTTTGKEWPSDAATGGDRTQKLVSRLQQLGAADTKLDPWGSNGALYRFTCRAPLANAPSMTRHFESIAADPAVAVQEVLSNVESWQIAQREGVNRRY